VIIQRLSIGDFGIFRDQVMEDIAPNIVLIAGPNRAGKTTLMQALRYLGYKFPRTDIIPPATTEYKLEADLQVDDSSRYVLTRSGYSDPQLSGNNGLQLRDIYHIDDFTYRQLFTISLDELRRIPERIDSKETKQLQSVLLGAGMVDLMMIPSVKSEFKKKADDIGGVNGNYSVKKFKSDNEVIIKAIEKRKQAHQEIEEYRQKQEELKETQMSVSEKSNQLTSEKNRLDQLRFLSERYQQFQEYKNLSREIGRSENQSILDSDAVENLERAKTLLQSYKKVAEEYEGQLRPFRQMIPTDDWVEMKEHLLEHQSAIEEWDRRCSGLEARVKKYISEDADNAQSFRKLQQRLQRLNKEFGDDLEILQEIRVDQIEKSHLRTVVSDYQKIEDRLERKSEELERSERELKALEEEFESLEKPSEGMTKLSVIRGSGIFVVVGMVLALFINATIGLIVGLGGVALVLGAAYISNIRSVEPNRRYNDKAETVSQKLRETEILEEERESLCNELKAQKEELNQLSEQLHLKEEVEPELLKEMHRDIEDLKEDYSAWKLEKERLESNETEISQDVEALTSVVKAIVEVPEKSYSLGEQTEFLIKRLNQISNWLQKAQSLQELITQKEELENEIEDLIPKTKENIIDANNIVDYKHQLNQYINKGETQKELLGKVNEQERLVSSLTDAFSGRISEVFLGEEGSSFDGEQILDLLEEHFNQFSSEDALKDELQRQEKDVHGLEEEIDQLKQQITRLEASLENLATSDKLDEAQRQIDGARGRLEPLAREYAINRIADFMLGKLRDKLLQRTKDELLSDASNIFKHLTSEAYKQIALPEELENADFLAISDNETESLKSEYLSRGTQEQLFLSVRMSRILDIEPPLPVILDDSLVNFDVQHRKKAAEMINTLSGHNQVFVLTCHPEIVDYIAEENSSIQFWTIHNQHIKLSDYDGVREVLLQS